MTKANAELIKEARDVLADMETRLEHDDCFVRVVDAFESSEANAREAVINLAATVVALMSERDAALARGWDEGVGRVVDWNKAANLKRPTDNPYKDS